MSDEKTGSPELPPHWPLTSGEMFGYTNLSTEDKWIDPREIPVAPAKSDPSPTLPGLTAEIDPRLAAHLGGDRAVPVPVTLEMIDAARAYLGDDHVYASRFLLGSIYRAMHAVAPVELVPEGERIAVKERDKLLEVYKSLCERHAVVTAERNLALAQRETARAELAMAKHMSKTNARLIDVMTSEYGAKIIELRAELAAAHDLLGQRPVVKVLPLGTRPHASDCAVHNEPALRAGPCDCGAMANPFRESSGDRRRLGA